jgi:hypothetical protein|tara:strand:+ start:381 stop:542 length:162 start_codon:yes stop_codon:yes gene_type:complete
MNSIKFIEKGFKLFYPDRIEIWKRGLNVGIDVGVSYVRFRSEIYKLSEVKELV